MLRRLSATILSTVSVILIVAGQPADARAKRARLHDGSILNVKTRIILNWNHSGQDVCFVHNSNGKRVVAYVDVYPAGIPETSTATMGPIFMAPIDDQKIFSWWGKKPVPLKCTVKSSQFQ